jgi:hypothetical protein
MDRAIRRKPDSTDASTRPAAVDGISDRAAVKARCEKRCGIRIRLAGVSCIVVTVTVLASGNNPPKPNTAPSLADLAVKTAIGVSLVAIAVRQHRRMGAPKKPPKWQAHVDTMSPWFAMGLAPALQPWVLDQRGRCRARGSQTVSAGSCLALVQPPIRDLATG